MIRYKYHDLIMIIIIIISIIIIMNVVGNNEVVRCDTAGAFQFVFVKAGSVAIVILRDGSLSVFPPGTGTTALY